MKLTSAEQRAKVLEENALKNADAKAKEIILETRDKLLREQQQQENEARDRRAELQKSERRLQEKESRLLRLGKMKRIKKRSIFLKSMSG